MKNQAREAVAETAAKDVAVEIIEKRPNEQRTALKHALLQPTFLFDGCAVEPGWENLGRDGGAEL